MSTASFDPDLAAELVRTACFAADIEMTGPVPVSRVRNPDGGSQPETAAERTGRIVRTAVMHLLETGLAVIAPDAAEKLEAGVPMRRTGT